MARNTLAPDDDGDERISRKPATPESAAERAKEHDPQQGTYLSADRGEREDDDSRASISAMSESEVEAFLRTEFTNQVLPTPPPIPGFHLCWLSTTNQYDTIAYRMRLGYTPVTPEEIPFFKSQTVKTGEYTGVVGVNEMLLYKIPESYYQKIMHIFHHERPAQEDERLRANLENLQQDTKGRPMIAEMGDGTEEMLRHRGTRAPAKWD